MTKLTLLAAAAALLFALSPSLAQEERQHQRRIPHRPDRPVSCNSTFFYANHNYEQPFTSLTSNLIACINF